MKLKWLGTAGFQIDTGESVLLIDPCLSRNPRSSPRQTLRPQNFLSATHIFISHGHFDHLADVPFIQAANNVAVHCSITAGNTLKKLGVRHDRIIRVTHHGQKFIYGHFSAQAYYSNHISFDLPLIARTLKRINRDALRLLCMHAGYPMGQVISWRFTAAGYSIQHFGSAGASSRELEKLAKMPLDLLLLPLQGHTHICKIALEYVRILKPRMVIPHHHDNFYPPISDSIDISYFVNNIRMNYPHTEVRVLNINDTIDL